MGSIEILTMHGLKRIGITNDGYLKPIIKLGLIRGGETNGKKD